MTILVATDLSASSSGALDVALALADKRGDREVILAHVADAGGDAKALDTARLTVEREAARVATTARLRVRVELLVGAASEQLIGLAETENAGLIVIAARSTHPSLLRLGSTTAEVIAVASVPVVVVRDPAPWLAFARGERRLRVLLGIDDSATCDLGIQWLHAMRAIGPIDVILGAIYYPDDAAAHYGLDAKSMVDRDPEIERLVTRDLLRRFGGDTAGVTAHARRGLGRIGDHVVELAREQRADVVLVGTGQKTGIGRLGSVSSVIVNDAPTSVVCVPPQADIPTQTVPILRASVVATDLSAFANRAVAYAFGVVEPDADVHIIHVVKDDEALDEADATRRLLALAPAGARQRVHAHVVRGDEAAVAIAQTAARLGVDVICIASHGRSGISRALVGSVADRLLRATRLPVLVLRPA